MVLGIKWAYLRHSALMTLSINDTQHSSIECHYAECHVFYCYAECNYAECRYAECRGAETNIGLGWK